MFHARIHRRFTFAVMAVLLCALKPCHAGMPITPVRISEVAALRIQALSFFIVLFFVLALVVKVAWNTLAKDFKAMPRITYLRSLCLMFIWGLAMSVLLTMISAARELMTPGAWERVGWTYKVTDPGMNVSEFEKWKLARKNSMSQLADALVAYAKAHEGKFPPHRYVPEIPAEDWRSLSPSQTDYVYLPDRELGQEIPEIAAHLKDELLSPLRIIAYEPDGLSAERWYMLSDGSLIMMNDNQSWRHLYEW